MRRITKPLTLTAAAALAGLAMTAVSCSGDGGSRGHHDKIEITNFAIDETIKSGQTAYLVTDSFTTTPFLTQLSIAVQWPEKLGNRSVTVLQDSLKSALFSRGVVVLPDGVRRRSNVEKLMRRFLAGEGLLDYEGAQAERLESLAQADSAEMAMEWYCNKTARIREFTETYVTYRVTEDSWTGGAHPNVSTSIFTFDLLNSQVLTPENMFTPQSRSFVVAQVKEALAEELDVPVARLAAAGIDLDELAKLGQPYLDGDNVVFFYDYYSIAPYYMGPFELAIPARDLQKALVPEVRSLL